MIRADELASNADFRHYVVNWQGSARAFAEDALKRGVYPDKLTVLRVAFSKVRSEKNPLGYIGEGMSPILPGGATNGKGFPNGRAPDVRELGEIVLRDDVQTPSTVDGMEETLIQILPAPFGSPEEAAEAAREICREGKRFEKSFLEWFNRDGDKVLGYTGKAGGKGDWQDCIRAVFSPNLAMDERTLRYIHTAHVVCDNLRHLAGEDEEKRLDVSDLTAFSADTLRAIAKLPSPEKQYEAAIVGLVNPKVTKAGRKVVTKESMQRIVREILTPTHTERAERREVGSGVGTASKGNFLDRTPQQEAILSLAGGEDAAVMDDDDQCWRFIFEGVGGVRYVGRVPYALLRAVSERNWSV